MNRKAAKPAAAPVRTASPPRPVAKLADEACLFHGDFSVSLRAVAARRLGQNACTSQRCDTLDGCHHDMRSDPAEPVSTRAAASRIKLVAIWTIRGCISCKPPRYLFEQCFWFQYDNQQMTMFKNNLAEQNKR